MSATDVFVLVVIVLGLAASVGGAVIALAKVIDPWVQRWETRRGIADVAERATERTTMSGRPEFFRPRYARTRARSRWS